MRILHITPSVAPQAYGVGQIALNLASAHVRIGHDAQIWCLDTEVDRQGAAEASGLDVSRIRGFPRIGPMVTGVSPAMYRAALSEGHGFDVVHQHGIWVSISHITRTLRSRLKLVSVVAPHGALQERVLRKSRLKKRLALLAYESANLHGASALQATAVSEIEDFHAFGLRQPIALITNGVPDTWMTSEGNAARFRAENGLPANARIALFMARIAPKKGLPLLLKAWAAVRQTAPDWLLVVAGADEDGHMLEVEQLVRELQIEDHVRFVGPQFAHAKRDAFAAAELFVLPSYSEGFPIVVLEALGASVPCIVTKGSSWAQLDEAGCGWWVDTSVEGIAHALSKATQLSPASLRVMGEAGRALIQREYHADKPAVDSIALYQWLQGRTEMPPFVTLP